MPTSIPVDSTSIVQPAAVRHTESTALTQISKRIQQLFGKSIKEQCTEPDATAQFREQNKQKPSSEPMQQEHSSYPCHVNMGKQAHG